MSRSESQSFATRVCHYYENCCGRSQKKTVRHFVEEGSLRGTIYNILARYQATGETKYKPLPGRPAKKTSPKNVEKVKKAFTKDPSLSVRVAARKLEMSPSAVSRMKVHKLGITARTKVKAPKYVKDQENRAKTGCRKIWEKSRKKVLIIDDETYVTFDPSQLPGRHFVHSVDHKQLEFHHKFKPLTKFPKKYLVWQAMDEIGNVSEPYISMGTMNQHVYLNECLKKRLLPFILKHHEISDILFWPDLATCHYANTVKEYLVSKNVDFVQKTENPPNVPQARGIEKFWAECKRLYHLRQETPKNLQGFKLVWSRISKEASKNAGRAIMDHAYKYVQQIGRVGLRKAMCDITNTRKH